MKSIGGCMKQTLMFQATVDSVLRVSESPGFEARCMRSFEEDADPLRPKAVR
jgi:hypothetical protein